MEQLLEYRVASLQGVGTRARQEDSYTVVNASDAVKGREEGLLVAVFDGMGGMKDGKLAGEIAVKSMEGSFRQMDRRSDLAPQLKQAIFTASSAVEKVIGGEGGSTAAVGIIFRDRLYFAAVGDSGLYLRRDGELNRLNTEHNICREGYLAAIRSGNLDPEIGREAEEAAALTQFLGRIGLDEADVCIRPLKLRAGDVLLVCSDGVSALLGEEDLCRVLSFRSEKAMRRQLEQEITLGAGVQQDNYTALIVKCENAGESDHAGKDR